jgi:hypothetical protein
MRPRGEIRLALGQAAVSLVSSGAPGGTWRDLAVMAGVGYDAAKRTAENMVRAGELLVVGVEPVPGANRKAHVLAPGPELLPAADVQEAGEQPRADEVTAALQLQSLVMVWRSVI